MPDEPTNTATPSPSSSNLESDTVRRYEERVIVQNVAIRQGVFEGPRTFIVSTDDSDNPTLLEMTHAAVFVADQIQTMSGRELLLRLAPELPSVVSRNEQSTDDAEAALERKIDAKLSDLNVQIEAEHTAITTLLDRLKARAT